MSLNFDILANKKLQLAIYGISVVLGLVILSVGYFFYYPAFQFHVAIAVAIFTTLLFPTIIITLDERRKRQIDDMLPRLLDDVAESQEAGMTLLRAFEESSKRRYGPITKELSQLVSQLTWGVEFDVAFLSFSKRIGTDLSAKVTTLLIEAMKLGGDLKSTFQSVALFVRELITLRDQRESEIKSYTMVIYMSVFVFMIVILILYNSFFLQMASSGAGSGGFVDLPMSLEMYKGLLFDLVGLVAFFGGITIGKLSGGKIISGFKHSIILVLSVTLIFGAFFLDSTPPIISDLVQNPLDLAMELTVILEDPFPGSGIKGATIVWTRNEWQSSQRVEMSYNLLTEYWETQIVQLPSGTKVQFYLEARDSSMNNAVDDNNGSYYRYEAGS